MKLFDHIAFRPSGPSCQNCIHFLSEPADIEAAFPGLTTMSSGYASVRDKDGLCTYHERYLSGRDKCPQLTRRTDLTKHHQEQ